MRSSADWTRTASGPRPPDTVRVYLGLGSNLGSREVNLREAVHRLQSQVRVDALSALYETPPMGPPDQPRYLNAACGGVTGLEPGELLAFIKAIEQEMGRVPTVRWGPRLIDIDILFYGDLVLSVPGLTIPHPGIPQRPFVLLPLADIAPDFTHPHLGEPVCALLKRRLSDLGQVRKIAESEEWYDV
jgi:2-amino-4-hydroxy-6-hydroxymethyldihydropteridine diphosphokinase